MAPRIYDSTGSLEGSTTLPEEKSGGNTVLYSLELGLCLREDAQAEVPVLIRFVGGGDDDVLSWRQAEATAHLTSVDEGLRAGSQAAAQEEFAIQADIPLS